MQVVIGVLIIVVELNISVTPVLFVANASVVNWA
jgi:hypothetical protein